MYLVVHFSKTTWLDEGPFCHRMARCMCHGQDACHFPGDKDTHSKTCVSWHVLITRQMAQTLIMTNTCTCTHHDRSSGLGYLHCIMPEHGSVIFCSKQELLHHHLVIAFQAFCELFEAGPILVIFGRRALIVFCLKALKKMTK